MTQLAILSLILLGVVTVIQLFYFFRYFLLLSGYQDKKGQAPGRVPVSVIVVARNEHKNLEANLASLLEQDYPDYEVIVVNNGSWDQSQVFLESMEERYSRLKVLKIVEQERYPKGKKFGLTLGIKAAKHEWLLLTDSDCTPNGNQWISSMSRHFVDNKEIVLGYSPYQHRAGILNALIRYEAFYTALQYLSFSMGRKTYMGVGRNLAYRKSLFFRVKGFASHNHVISGDDDLFVNETATATNTRICINPEAFVYSKPKETWSAWMQQKKRHLSVGRYYSAKSKWLLGLLQGSYIGFYFLLAASIVLCAPIRENYLYLAPLAIYGIRLISQYFVYGFAMGRLKEKSLIYFLPFFDIFFAFFFFFMGFGALFGRRKKGVW